MSNANNKKGYITGLLCYFVWGLLPIYWNLLSGVNPLLILCCRIIFAFLILYCLQWATGRLHVFRGTLKNKQVMKYLIPASVLVTFNWGLFIWAVNTGHILDSSLGYYMNPLIAFSLGVLVLREGYSRLQLVAVGLALTGVIISVVAYGSFPIISISLATTFAVYGVLKKKACADPIAGIAVESLLMTPFAIIFALVFLGGSIRSAGIPELLLLAGGGLATATPLVMYSSAVNKIPFITISFFQYISPSMTLIYGLLTGETLSSSQLVSFVFIGLGLIVFTIAVVRKTRAAEPKEREQC